MSVVTRGAQRRAVTLWVAPERRAEREALALAPDGNALRFSVGQQRPIYLTSDGTTDFAAAPEHDALPALDRGAWSLAVEDATLWGPGEVSVWVIAYDRDGRRGQTAVATLPSSEAAGLDVLEGGRVRVALRLAGEGRVLLGAVHIEPGAAPRCLVASAGRFHRCVGGSRPPTAARTPVGAFPSVLPVSSVAVNRAPRPPSEPLCVFLTIDTEDAYHTPPHLMTGEGLGRDYGAYGIMDLLNKHGLVATFFVNVYEHLRHAPGLVQTLVCELDDHGHEVALHTHPAPELSFYDRPLFRYGAEHQRRILDYGVGLIAEWTGVRPTTFRAGAYAINADSPGALADVGIAVDSSFFHGSPNNHLERRVVNALDRLGVVTEVPVTTVARLRAAGRLEQRKLDWDWLEPRELWATLECLHSSGARTAMFMMHSFSFIDKATLRVEEPRSPRSIFCSAEYLGRRSEIYGVKEDAPERFAAFLSWIARDERFSVRTLGDAAEELSAWAVEPAADVIPVVNG